MEAVLQGAGEWGSGSLHICWGRGEKEKEVASESYEPEMEAWRGKIADRPVWKHLGRKRERLKCRQKRRRVLGLRRRLSNTEPARPGGGHFFPCHTTGRIQGR